MRFNLPIIINMVGLLLIFAGTLMLTCVPVALYYWEGEWLFLTISASLTIVIGLVSWLSTRKVEKKSLKKRDGYLIVTAGWLFMSLFGSMPYFLTGAIPDFSDAVFETISGFTTTGATILDAIDHMPKSILFWRSLTQWIGGMGIIVLAVAILPLLGIGGMQLFVAEAPGISPDKLQPRIQETAKRLWLIYIGLTFIETFLLWLGGMSWFNALNHSLTTMATGGFSTRQDSIAFYESAYIQYVITFFMFLAGTNFTLTYFALKGKLKKVWASEEFRYYVRAVAFITLVVAITIYSPEKGIERSFRDALFQVVSLITTTGFITADYSQWAHGVIVLFFILMFIGASAGSTAGGVKIVRHVLLIKNSLLELKRQLHPSGVIPVRLNQRAVPRDITFHVLAFIMIYISIFGAGAAALAMFGVDFETAIGAAATSLGNIGPGFGQVGPVNNFAGLPTGGKWLLGFLMLLGRLELFTILMLFTPYFWRKYG